MDTFLDDANEYTASVDGTENRADFVAEKRLYLLVLLDDVLFWSG